MEFIVLESSDIDAILHPHLAFVAHIVFPDSTEHSAIVDPFHDAATFALTGLPLAIVDSFIRDFSAMSARNAELVAQYSLSAWASVFEISLISISVFE